VYATKKQDSNLFSEARSNWVLGEAPSVVRYHGNGQLGPFKAQFSAMSPSPSTPAFIN